MEVIKEDKENMEFKLDGEDSGIAALITEKLLQSSEVKFASSEVDHPLKGNPVIHVMAKEPKKELSKALDKVQEELGELQKELQKVGKKG